MVFNNLLLKTIRKPYILVCKFSLFMLDRRDFFGMWMMPPPTNSKVGEHPNRQINVKHRHT